MQSNNATEPCLDLPAVARVLALVPQPHHLQGCGRSVVSEREAASLLARLNLVEGGERWREAAGSWEHPGALVALMHDAGVPVRPPLRQHAAVERDLYEGRAVILHWSSHSRWGIST